MAIPVSPLAVALPELPTIAGVRLGAAAAGIRYKGRTDLVMAEFAPGTQVAGVFTRNLCPGAPVDWCRAALSGGVARALVVNAGNANVFTGRAGKQVPVADTVKGFKEILEGKHDDVNEGNFYMKGGIEEIAQEEK